MDYKPKYGAKIILVVIIVICLAIFVWILKEGATHKDKIEALPLSTNQSTSTNTPTQIPAKKPAVEVIATGLKIPWDIAFLPDKTLLVTERAGNLVHIGKDGTTSSIKLPHPVPKGEGGLLGITLHPNFAQNKLLYMYMTTGSSLQGTKNAVFRYRYENEKLTDEKIIISDIPGALYHDGGRLEFGPDGFLYITTGDAQTSNIAQDLKSLGGKILRLTADGEIPADNPFGTAVYSYGHRNPQGLAWDSEGRLWSTEHGRSGITSGMDEINLIVKGKNYGWPTIEGDKSAPGMQTPIENSGPDVTWAPASLLYLNGKLYFGGLLGQSLYEAVIDEDHIHAFNSYFHNAYGRIRTVRLGPDGMLYLTTSNRDGRGTPVAEDDRIVRVDPKGL